MRVLMVNTGVWPAPNAFGGTENVVYGLANHLAKLGSDVDLVSDVDKFAEFNERVTIYPVGLPSIRLYEWGFLGYCFRHFVGGLYSYSVARKLLSGNYDIIHVHGRLAPFLLSFHKNNNIVYTIHDDPPKKGLSFLLVYKLSHKLLIEGTARRAKRIITLHEGALNHLKEIGIPIEKIQMFPNGVDTGLFKPQTDKKKEYCLYIGSLIPRKGVHYLIKSVVRIENLSCVIVGDGPDKYRLQKLVRELGIEEKITFAGAINKKQELAGFYNSAKFLVLPSLIEGFPLVILEAMACALPVIASNIPGPAALIKGGENGFLFRPGSVEELSIVMKMLNDSPELREQIGQRNRMLVERDYSWKSVAKRTLSLYEELVGAN